MAWDELAPVFHAAIPFDRGHYQPVPVEREPLDLGDMFWEHHLREFRGSEEFRREVDQAAQRVEPVFRRIEALRMNLAKHEVPKKKGERAMAPGYGRIDYGDGSISWMVDLGENNVDVVSRRSIANQLRLAVIGSLPEGEQFDEDSRAED